MVFWMRTRVSTEFFHWVHKVMWIFWQLKYWSGKQELLKFLLWDLTQTWLVILSRIQHISRIWFSYQIYKNRTCSVSVLSLFTFSSSPWPGLWTKWRIQTRVTALADTETTLIFWENQVTAIDQMQNAVLPSVKSVSFSALFSSFSFLHLPQTPEDYKVP